jgi:hypothetical protein
MSGLVSLVYRSAESAEILPCPAALLLRALGFCPAQPLCSEKHLGFVACPYSAMRRESRAFCLQMLGGYVLPLTGLYIWEMRDRWVFAKAHGLPVSGIKDTLLRGVRPVLIETAMNLFVVSTFRLDY